MAGRIAYYGNIVTQGLVLDLDAAIQGSYPKTGSTWFDISNNGNNGTLTNGPTYSPDNFGSIVFDGVNDYVNLLTPPSFNNAVTFNVFVMKTQSKNSAGVYSFKGSMMQFDDNAIRFWFDISKPNLQYNFIPTLNQWYCITITQDNYLNNMYINGSLVNTVTTPFLLHSGSFFNKEIGSYITDNRFFLGKISTTQVYNRALSPTEITQNFNALRGRYGI